MTDLPSSRFQSPRPTGIIDALDRYWRGKRGGHSLPARADLDPSEFRFALGNVSFIDVLTGPLQFRFRMVATNIQARFDRSLTGTYVRALPEPENARLWEAVYRTVVRTGEPQTFVGRVVEDGEERLYRGRVWPLASDHKDVDMLFCCREPFTGPRDRGPDTPEQWRR